MRVFVTGGAGYVGSHCVKRLVAGGHEVTVFDSLLAGHREAVDPRAEFIRGDLADKTRLAELLAPGRFDAVMHFAALLNVGESVDRPLQYYRNNVANTLNLLECMQAAGLRRIVFSSTCAVYGEPERLPLTEDMPTRPISPYGATKLSVEYMLQQTELPRRQPTPRKKSQSTLPITSSFGNAIRIMPVSPRAMPKPFDAVTFSFRSMVPAMPVRTGVNPVARTAERGGSTAA